MDSLYFAYGSNLHAGDFEQWCRARGHAGAALEPVAAAWLPDHAPIFHYHSQTRRGGALDVVPCFGHAVPGALFRLDPATQAAVEQKEGVGKGVYQRHPVLALTEDGQAHEAFTFRVCAPHVSVHVPPTPAYLSAVSEGLERFGHPVHGLLAAACGEPPASLLRSIFVYGTLRPGESRHGILRSHPLLRLVDGRAPGRLLHLGAYPGLVPSLDSEVVGTLCEYTDAAELLRELDAIEDFLGYGRPGSLYRRSLVRVRTLGGVERAWAYVYVGRSVGAPVIGSGDWLRRG